MQCQKPPKGVTDTSAIGGFAGLTPADQKKVEEWLSGALAPGGGKKRSADELEALAKADPKKMKVKELDAGLKDAGVNQIKSKGKQGKQEKQEAMDEVVESAAVSRSHAAPARARRLGSAVYGPSASGRPLPPPRSMRPASRSWRSRRSRRCSPSINRSRAARSRCRRRRSCRHRHVRHHRALPALAPQPASTHSVPRSHSLEARTRLIPPSGSAYPCRVLPDLVEPAALTRTRTLAQP